MITAAVTAAILFSVKAKRDSDKAYSKRALARDTKDKSGG
jgi:ATP-binding cassette subfamily D (ALD) protein 3